MNALALFKSDTGRRAELWLIVATLIVATFLRFYRLDAVPPGPSHDELRMMQLGELIVDGERPIHWKISYSAEPLYMYLLAMAMPIWGFTPFGARLITRFVGVLLIPVTHRLVERLLGRRVALFSSWVLALTWWPLFFSRVALRGLTLSLFFTVALICLWKGLGLGRGPAGEAAGPVRWRSLVIGAALTGLTWYTFTAARAVTVFLPIFLAYLGLFRFVERRRLVQVALLTIGVAALIAAPFVYEMVVHPGVPETRLDQLGGILGELRAGNPLPLLEQSANTLGLFMLAGDPNWRYNLSGRPPFGPALGGLAVLGVLLSLVRWRQPGYFAFIVWTLLGLAPSMLTPEAPSFVRGIGALPAVAVFPGIGAVALWDWLKARAGRRAGVAVPLVLAVVLGVNGGTVFRDYFASWPVQPEVREIYQASLTEAFKDLVLGGFEGPLWISEPFLDDRNLLLADYTLHGEGIKPRWLNADRGLILPPADGLRRYLLADFVQPDPVLFSRWMSDGTVVLERHSPTGVPAYRVLEVEGGPWVERELRGIGATSVASLDVEGQQSVVLPAQFDGRAALLGYELGEEELVPGESVHLVVYWRVRGPVYTPLASFAHLLDAQGVVVGQYDGFDVPPWHWQTDAVVAQVYQFPVAPNAQPGPHWLEVGLYDAQSMVRWPVVDDQGSQLGDRLVLCKVSVE